MWLIFDTVADCAKFFGAAKEISEDPIKGIPSGVDSLKKVTTDINSLMNPPAPITVNVPMPNDATTPATAGDAWNQARACAGTQARLQHHQVA